jgi:cytochrome oxidase Cu insertion factor (SCO1/SenC/PrrC family)
MSRMFSGFQRIVVSSLVVAATGAGQARAPQSSDRAAMVDVETVGPKAGEAVPDFSLSDQHGQTRSLKSLLGRNGAVIVFFRSADW